MADSIGRVAERDAGIDWQGKGSGAVIGRQQSAALRNDFELGRASEVLPIENFVSRTVGTVGALTIAGDAGMGETTLLDAAARQAGDLQRALVDVLDLHRQSKQPHWTVVDRDFRGIHRQLDDIAAVADAASDVVAERMRAIGVIPDGRTRVVAVPASLANYLPGERDVADVVWLVTERMREVAVANVIWGVEPAVSAEDVVTADMLHTVIADLEQQAWMLCSDNVDRSTPLRAIEPLP